MDEEAEAEAEVSKKKEPKRPVILNRAGTRNYNIDKNLFAFTGNMESSDLMLS